jgi:hypothetical protein
MPTRDNWATTATGRFFAAIFDPDDHVSFRPTETWTETGSNGQRQKKSRVIYKEARTVQVRHIGSHYNRLLEVCKVEKANFFFGVCPRFGRKHDKSWQIRVVRVLWADIDNCQPTEAIERCKKAGVPLPSIVVNSGNGVHLYWLLAEPYLIDDVGDPPAVEVEWIDQGQRKRKRRQEWYRDEVGNCHELPYDAPGLSPKAIFIQDVMSGIASAIGGDKTHDLARLLRVPGTLNRKDERNGRAPVACELVEIHVDRRYHIDDFAKWVDLAPTNKERNLIAAVPLPAPRKRISATKQDKLNELITTCAVAPVGERSERDWALICFAIRKGLPREELWQQVANVGKFAERGEAYFLGRWVKAEQTVRQNIYEKAAKAAKASLPKAPAIGDGQSPNGAAISIILVPSVFLAEGRTDSTNSRRFVRGNSKLVRWCDQWGRWLVWDGQRWANENKCETTAKAKSVFCEIWSEIGVPSNE